MVQNTCMPESSFQETLTHTQIKRYISAVRVTKAHLHTAQNCSPIWEKIAHFEKKVPNFGEKDRFFSKFSHYFLQCTSTHEYMHSLEELFSPNVNFYCQNGKIFLRFINKKSHFSYFFQCMFDRVYKLLELPHLHGMRTCNIRGCSVNLTRGAGGFVRGHNFCRVQYKKQLFGASKSHDPKTRSSEPPEGTYWTFPYSKVLVRQN